MQYEISEVPNFFFIIYVFIELKYTNIQIIQTFYIQIPFLCRVTAGTRHMKGSTVDMQNPNAVPPSPHPKTNEKNSLNSRPLPIPIPRKM